MQSLPEIARAKLRGPWLDPDRILRPRLTHMLERARQKPLTLVSAPAGFGKTTLLSELQNHSSLPTAWLSLDRDDSSLPTFAYYMMCALQSVLPAACERTLAMLHATAPQYETLARRLANELADLSRPALLILDDYHLIEGAEVHGFLAALLRQMPPTLHLVIGSRVDPPLPLARLRADGQLLEIRTDALRFTRSEIEAFLARVAGLEAGPELVEIVERQTEGWPVGIRLACLSYEGQHDVDALMRRVQGRSNRFIMDYLLGEVLAQQPLNVQEFLVKSSVLEALSAPLTSAILGEANVAAHEALIASIHKANLFLVPVDEDTGWYRYHHLFRDLLRHRLALELSHEEIQELQRRAGRWCLGQKMVVAALRYALAAGDEERAAEIVEENIERLVLEDKRMLLRQALDLLPATLQNTRPALLLARVWLAIIAQGVDSWRPLLQSADRRLNDPKWPLAPERRRVLQAESSLFWGMYAFYSAETEQAMAALDTALRDLPPSHAYARGLAIVYFVLTLQSVGQSKRALALIDDVLSHAPAAEPAFQLLSYMALLGLHYQEGSLGDVLLVGRTAQRIGQAARHNHLLAYAETYLGHVAYEQNQIAEARAYYQRCSHFEQSGNLRMVFDATAGQILCDLAEKRHAEATQRANDLIAFADQSDNNSFRLEANSLRARVALAVGDHAAARQWLYAPAYAHPSAAPIHHEVPLLTRALVQIEAGSDEDLCQAVVELESLHDLCARIHSNVRRIQVNCLRARAYDALGRRTEALDCLEQAVGWGVPRGFVRSYLDLSDGLLPLLHELARRQRATVAAERLAALLAATGNGTMPAGQAAPNANTLPLDPAPEPHSPRADVLLESLTWREQQVLELLSRRYSDKEIAETLVISATTVRSHVGHIFGKLGVNDRRAAVRVAHQYGLLQTQDATSPQHALS